MTLELVPISLDEANAFVEQHHRHHKAARGCISSVAVAAGGTVVGVAIIGRPVSRHLQDGWTAEVVRVATDGTRNACSMLYGAAWRAVRALGYRRLVTYTLPEEGGASLRASGFALIGEAGGGFVVQKRPATCRQAPDAAEASVGEDGRGVTEALKAPFVYFGGKSKVADVIWTAFGDPPNYIEPFFGSGAVLLRRPSAPKIETINDIDGDVANFWRAVSAVPDEVAEFADWPVNEMDMHARAQALLATDEAFQERMHADPEFFDSKRAGWWAWGMSTAIGGNWLTKKGLKASPRICGWVEGNGLHVPARSRPNLSHSNGVHSLPALGHSGRGLHAPERISIEGWMRALAARLRRVRVACGDWSRVVTGAVTGASNTLKNMGMSPCAIFFDAPYGPSRSKDCYRKDSVTVAADAAAWAIEHGDDPHFRIAFCGYEGEHEFPSSWTVHAWKAQGGHSNRSGNNENRYRERVWFSPHCLSIEGQRSLFDVASAT